MSALDDYKQLFNAYPNANRFLQALRGNIERNVPTQADLENPESLAQWSTNAALNAPIGLATKTAHQLAHDIAQKNAVEMLGLPANNTAMDRAKALGFEGNYYHGTGSDIHEFITTGNNKTAGAGAFVTNNPTVAETYAPSITQSPNIYPLMIKKEGLMSVNAKGRNWNDINTNDLSHNRKKLYNLFEDYISPNDVTSTDEIAGLAPYGGFSGVEIKNIKDLGPNTHIFRAKEYLQNKYGIPISEKPDYWENISSSQFDEARKEIEKLYGMQKSDVVSLQNPKNIRSRFAAFDPAKIESSDILASLAPLAVLGYANKTDENKQRYIDLLRGQ